MPSSFGIHVAQNRVDAFLLGVVDETARVDDHHLSIIIGGFVHGIHAIAAQLRQQYLSIHLVLEQPSVTMFTFFLNDGFKGFPYGRAKVKNSRQSNVHRPRGGLVVIFTGNYEAERPHV